MQILILTQNYPPERGPVRYTRNVAVQLVSQGHHVTVITGVPHYPIGKPYPGFSAYRVSKNREDGVDVIRVPVILGANYQVVRRILGFFSFMLTSLPMLIFKPCDIMIASVPPVTTAAVTWFVSALRRKPLVIILRDIEPLASFKLRGIEKRWLGRLLISVGMFFYRRADRLVTITREQEYLLLAYGISASRLTTIPHCVDTSLYATTISVNTDTTLAKQNGRAVALYVGTIGVSHDLTTLISAMSDSRIQALPIDLVIVGDGECAEACRETILRLKIPNVRMLPSVSLDKVPGLLAQADILVSSFKDGQETAMSSKIYEYCASGKPIVVFGKSGASRLVAELGNGWVCDSRQVDELLAALTAFLGNRMEAAANGLRGRHFVESERSSDHFARQWDRLCKEIVS